MELCGIAGTQSNTSKNIPITILLIAEANDSTVTCYNYPNMLTIFPLRYPEKDNKELTFTEHLLCASEVIS